MGELTGKLLPLLKRARLSPMSAASKGSVVADSNRRSRCRRAFRRQPPDGWCERRVSPAARADLFVNAACIVTPTPNSDKEAVAKVEQFMDCGRRAPAQALARRAMTTSSAAPATYRTSSRRSWPITFQSVHPPEQAAVCANGFRDTTRIASGSPEMWCDIAMATPNNLSRVLGVFIEDLQEFRPRAGQRDVKAVEEFFRKKPSTPR